MINVEKCPIKWAVVSQMLKGKMLSHVRDIFWFICIVKFIVKVFISLDFVLESPWKALSFDTLEAVGTIMDPMYILLLMVDYRMILLSMLLL